MQSTIAHKVFFKHSPKDVWEYLVTPELIAQWLMTNDFVPVMGHKFQFRTRPMPNYHFDGIVNCEVLEVEPGQRLSYSWRGGSDGVVTLDSVVVWTLEAKDGGTELSLQHTGFGAANADMYTIMNDGWLRNMKKIGDLLKAATHGANA